MLRKPIIAGNWKMHKNPNEAATFVQALVPKLAAFKTVDKVVAPTTLALPSVAAALRGTDLHTAAQDAHWEAQGAYTSQVSAAMLAEYADYAIIGHSECRAYLNESDANVNRKAKALLAHGLQPIIAVGESLAQNEAGATVAFVRAQVHAALRDISEDDMARVIIAYEPIWAIGTGKSASGEGADAIIRSAIREPLATLYGEAVAAATRIQYGGSVKPQNMAEFMRQPNIDGALVGGASLQKDAFCALVEIAAHT